MYRPQTIQTTDFLSSSSDDARMSLEVIVKSLLPATNCFCFFVLKPMGMQLLSHPKNEEVATSQNGTQIGLIRTKFLEYSGAKGELTKILVGSVQTRKQKPGQRCIVSRKLRVPLRNHGNCMSLLVGSNQMGGWGRM